jgi:hypothetical protein
MQPSFSKYFGFLVMSRTTESDGVNFNIVSAPVPESRLEAGVEPMMFAAFIHPDSKRQSEAMEVINYLISIEAQSMLSARGEEPYCVMSRSTKRLGALCSQRLL